MSNKKEIINIISKFANSFDKNDWDGLKSVLSNEIKCNYSNLRGNKERTSAEDYVSKRIEALNHLKTHHMFSNYEINDRDREAKCVVSAIIWRRSSHTEFVTHALYTFGFRLEEDGWRICTIKQQVLWNEGDPSIHSGAKNSR